MTTTIGIDLGGTNMRAARIDAAGTILDRRIGPTPAGADAVIAALAGMIAEIRDAGTAAIGVGFPSRVDATRRVVFAGGYVDLSCAAPVERLQDLAGLPVAAENDASMALAGEARLGAAKGFGHAVLLTIGTGVGGAVYSAGRLFHGGGMAGQLGHLTVTQNGRRCSCGRDGCLETESSGTALGRHITEAGLPPGTRADDLLERDDAAARRVIEAWAGPLRDGIDSLVAAFSPEIVVLGGGLGAAAAKAIARFPPRSNWFQCPVIAASLGDEAGMIGAALTAREAIP